MKAKRFTAPSMKKALDMVSKELGKDAVILSNKKVEGGVEVIAALDYQSQMDTIEQDTVVQKEEVSRQLALQQELERARQATDQIRNEAPLDEPIELFGRKEEKPELAELSEIKNVLTQLQQELNQKPVISKQELDEQEIKVRAKAAELKKRQQENKKDKFSFAESDQGGEGENLQIKKTQIKTGAHTSAQQPTNSEPLLNKVSDELKELKNWLVSQQGNAWAGKGPLTWQQGQILQRCQDLGIEASWADKLVVGLKQDEAIEKLWKACLLKMARELPIAEDSMIDQGGCIALIGPNGAGKTTTIGKLAAQYVVKHGADKVALVTLDTYRIAAHEQLKAFARLMGVKMHVISPEGDLNQLLDELQDKRFVLIDTAGLSSQDPHFSAQLSMLKSAGHRIKKLLTLPLTSQARCLQENFEHFQPIGLHGCLFTKLDECFSLGQALSIAALSKLPIHMVADGPHVPDDLHFPNAKKLVGLAEQMARLAQARQQPKAAMAKAQ